MSWRHSNATLCAQAMHVTLLAIMQRSADASPACCATAHDRLQRGHRLEAEQQWRLRIKTPPLICVPTARSLGKKGLQLLCGCGTNYIAQEGVARGMSSRPASMPAANIAVCGLAAIEMQSLSCCVARDAVRLPVCTWRRTEPARRWRCLGRS